MISVENLRKEFKLNKEKRKELGTCETMIRVVNDISFECKPGRIFSLLGPNGAGKTTTLRVIASIIKPSAGRVTVAGMDVVENPLGVKQKLGFLTGSTGLYHRLTADEFIKYFADLYNVPKQVFEERKDRLYTLLDMHDFARKRLGQLSTGMKQKVSIVRTIIHDPDVIVFDEPTSGLDVISAANIINLVKDCKAEGKTVLFSSHIMSEVDLLCDDLAIIHRGNLLYSGTMEEYRTNMQSSNLTAEFIRIVNQASA